jgi:hypothetical protein
MTFTELQNEVIDRMNLTSATAIARVGRNLNDRYKWVASSIGMQTTARGTATANTVSGNQSVTFTSVEKIYSVYNSAFTPPQVLGEVTVDQLRNMPLGSYPPQQFAIQLMGSTSVTIKLDYIPTTVYALGADVEAILATLSGSQVPAFSQSFHDILIYGAMATELEKMEKYEFAKKQEGIYQTRLGELRLFIAKSAYKDIHQGKTSHGSFSNLV